MCPGTRCSKALVPNAQVPGLHVRARRLSERAHLAATRGRLHNLEELHISGLRDENDVQVRVQPSQAPLGSVFAYSGID